MDTLAGSLAARGTPAERAIWASIVQKVRNDRGLLGYRLPSIGERDSERVPSIVLISELHGIVLVAVIDEQLTAISDDGEYFITSKAERVARADYMLDDFASRIETRLRENNNVFDRRTRSLRVPIRKVLVLYDTPSQKVNIFEAQQHISVDHIIDRSDPLNALSKYLDEAASSYDGAIVDQAIAEMEGTTALARSSKGQVIAEPRTRNDLIAQSLKYIFKLDNIQRQVAMQIPDGPQRIRGLAGTGKTVILSLKTALAHKDFPDFRILFLFDT
jgi:superfamily I DNA and RNA helicase